MSKTIQLVKYKVKKGVKNYCIVDVGWWNTLFFNLFGFVFSLCRKLTQEEYERQEKEQKLSAADEKAVLAIEEVKVYK